MTLQVVQQEHKQYNAQLLSTKELLDRTLFALEETLQEIEA